MKERYIRNRLYLNEKEQSTIREYPILLAGSGIGSVIAECALRLGFECLTIIDCDQVELSNLNRQNYTEADVCYQKVEAIRSRLLSINAKADITVSHVCLSELNISEFINEHKIVVNALDFSSKAPLELDRVCCSRDIHILHPYNLGWGGLVTVIKPKGVCMEILDRNKGGYDEVTMIDYAMGYMRFWGDPQGWIEEILDTFKIEGGAHSPPQLSLGSWIVASMCTHVLFNISTGKEFKTFPEFYYSSIMEN